MKFGLMFEMQRPSVGPRVDQSALINETIDQCVAAETAGFDEVWLVEHHFLTTFSGCPAPDVMLSAIARETRRIRLGFGVMVLPYHHPIQVAERVAMVDHISGGRVDFGTGRGSAYEQVGMGVDPRETRELWDESLRLIASSWTSGNQLFSWDGPHFHIPPRDIIPKPKQTPHPPMWMAGNQPSSYDLAAEYGVGVLSFGTGAPALLKEHIDRYRDKITTATPVGAAVNAQWGNLSFGHCSNSNQEAQDIGGRIIKEFFGPNRPYTQDREEVYQKLLDSWGGIPQHLEVAFARFTSGAQDLGGGNVPRKQLAQLPADLLAERGVIIAGDPSHCIDGARKHEAAGVDQLMIVMQSDQIAHDDVMKSIKLFGQEVIPAFL